MKIIKVKLKNQKVTIKFISKNYINKSYVKIITDNEHYFRINEIETGENNTLIITAVEVAHYDNYFYKKEDFDIRTLLNMEVSIVTNKNNIIELNYMS